ncbi:trypsin-like serine protease [Hyalangium gracile]|uniref:trypsin-like serine protease n=1 Tax=Hyalangium gracile TaxID=394092 RepID=UPI001CCFB153|nr:trypsin-like serine protease [Hyalangium gracile]
MLVIGLLLSCERCHAHSPKTATVEPLPTEAGVGGDDTEFVNGDDYEVLPIGERMSLPDGEWDVTNRYSFAVMLQASFEPHGSITCSGALISPRLVLTAGHCVCKAHEVSLPNSKARSVIDSSRCARTATAETVIYTPKHIQSERSWDEQYRSSSGKVRPHPGLEILLDEQGLPISSKSDLAVVVLDRPIDGTVPAIRLPTSELPSEESFVIVGHGLDGRNDLILGRRRSGRKKLARPAPPNGDVILFSQAGAPFTRGSGDSCLRQDKGEAVLLGITTLSSKEGDAFVSIYPYRDWLVSELQRASLPSRSPPRDEDTIP